MGRVLFRNLLTPLSSLLLLAVAEAQTRNADWLALEDFPGARAMLREHKQETSYTLALGIYKKIGGSWDAERQQRLNGALSRRTLELPSDRGAREGFQFYRKQLQAYPLRELFACQGRDCGGSTNWANHHFEIPQLYGLDPHQYYGVYELSSEQTLYYASLYAVRRGNGRVYVQLDLLRTEPDNDARPRMTLSSMIDALAKQGYFVLDTNGARDLSEPGWAPPDALIEPLVELLQAQSSWRLALVGHDYGPATLEQQRRLSKGYAEALKGALVSSGVAEQRLETYGLGSLAPAGRRALSARLEVVKLSDE